jgi:Lar family restriction alleviation protein
MVIENCPFCGHDDVVIDEVETHEYSVCCPECGCVGPIDTGSPQGAINLWNVRDPCRTTDH